MKMRYGLSMLIVVAVVACCWGPAMAASVREEALSVQTPGGNLAGTLTIPDGTGPFPVALIIAGSGPTDRDGNSRLGLKTDAYKKLAQGLAGLNIATLRYDKRGIGASSIQRTESEVRFEDFINDALSLTALLEKDSRFNSVSIIGHSEGSLIGMVAAQRDPRVLVTIEGMNHILVDAPADRAANVATYNDPSRPLSANLVPAIAGFLRALR